MIRYIEGFSRFVTSAAAPIASGRNDSCRVGFAPTGRPCLCTAHAAKDDTRQRGGLEQTIETERARLFQASAVLKCLYEVLLYADGDDAVTYAEAAHLSATLIDQSLENLDSVRLRPQINQLKHAHDYPLPEEGLNSGLSGKKVEDIRAVYTN